MGPTVILRSGCTFVQNINQTERSEELERVGRHVRLAPIVLKKSGLQRS